jgi:hypothetical protein
MEWMRQPGGTSDDQAANAPDYVEGSCNAISLTALFAICRT